MRDPLEVLPVSGIGEITPGDDLAAMIAAAAPWLRDGDVLVVTSKIVSKAEGRLVPVPASGPQREAAREEILASQTAREVARRGHTRIVQTHHGFVMASAGIDASNVERSRLVLLPADPDASARALRAALRERFGLNVAVIVSDTMGRPWRNGLTDVALGAAGLDPILDHRGQTDPYGNEMHVTLMAVADELSAAAELVKGKFDQVPVAVVRGYLATAPAQDGPGAATLIRDAAHDLFSLGTAEARAAGLADAAALSPAPFVGTAPSGTAPSRTALDDAAPDGADPLVVKRVLAGLATAPHTVFTVVEPDEDGSALRIACTVTGPADADRWVALGIDVHRLRCALAAAGFASRWHPPAPAGGDGLLDVGWP